MSAQKSAAPRLYRPPTRVVFWNLVARHKWTAAAAALAMPLAVGIVGSYGCSGADDEESDAPLVASAMPPPPVATVPVDEDAGAPDAAASASAKPKAPPADPMALKLCCDTIRNNAKTAPDDQKEPLSRAADVCDSVARSPQARPGLIAVRSMLKGASLPSECK